MNQAAPQAQRTVLERHDQSGVPGKEIVLGTAMLPSGAGIGYHTHPGDESRLCLQGQLSIESSRTTRSKRLSRATVSSFRGGTVHSLVAAAGPDGGTAVSTWIIDKGQPLATPVP